MHLPMQKAFIYISLSLALLTFAPRLLAEEASAVAEPADGVAVEAPAVENEPAEAAEEATAEEGVVSEPLPALKWFDGTVTRVRDTDLIEIAGEKVRLLGVTGPRRWWWGAPRDCHANESISFLEGMIKDKDVQYAFDPAVGPDRRHGFRRVYVMVDEHLVNADLVEKGMALADRSRHYLMKAKFEELEDAASLHMLGLWHRCPVECYREGKVCRVKNW